jgi:ATP-dependent protease ClpP protease subunit
MSEHISDLVYKQFLQEKAILINGEITQDTVDQCAMQIIKYNLEDDQLEKDGECGHCGKSSYDRLSDPIRIYIHSNGGSVDDCLAVIGCIEASRTPVHCIALGEAQSAGFVILISGHVRSCHKFSRLMYHEISTGFRGDLKYIKNKADEATDLQAILDEIVVLKTTISKEELEERIHRKDWYIKPDEAVRLGVVDFVEGSPLQRVAVPNESVCTILTENLDEESLPEEVLDPEADLELDVDPDVCVDLSEDEDLAPGIFPMEVPPEC